MNLNLVVPKVANLRIEWFHYIGSQKSSGSIEFLSKIEWFHGTTGTTTNAGPAEFRMSIFVEGTIRIFSRFTAFLEYD